MMEDKTKILIVEDERVSAEYLKANLQEKGYEVVGICPTGEMAIRNAPRTQPDIILMDIKLKDEMDGVEASKKINELMDVPVIYITAYGDEETMKRAKVTGPYAFINKPFRMNNILSTIEMTLYRHEMEQKLRKAIMDAEKANEAKTQFLAHMSHEIRNPMNVIKGVTDLFDKMSLTQKQTRYLGRLKTSTNNILGIIDEILDISRIEAGKIALENKNFALRPIIENVVETNSALSEKKGVKILEDVAADVPEYMVGDPRRLWQILNNLLGNAVKFTDVGSCGISVELNSSGPGEKDKIKLLFSVHDSGIGIPKDKQQDIFKSYTQVEISNAKKFGGTGLGLAISKRFIQMMGGNIEIKSKLGKGSTFSFTANFDFSKGLGDKKWDTGKIPTSEMVALKPRRILLADDSPDNQEIVSELLRINVPHKVTCASNGEEAIKYLKEKRFHLILMDVEMPIVDGIKATRFIRRSKTGEFDPKIPIIALTGYAIKGDRERFLEAGMDDYLQKPFGHRELHEVIDRVLKNG